MEELIEIEFKYNEKKIIFQCNPDKKMNDIFKDFVKKSSLDNKKLSYLYNGTAIEGKDLALNKIINKADYMNNKMTILVIDYQEQISKTENKYAKKPKIIVCPECKENIKIDIIDFKINLYECKNGHKIENILLNEFEETQKIELP